MSSNGTIFRITGPLCGEFTVPGEFPAQRPVTRSFDDFFDLRLNKRLSKHSWGWWFDTLSRPLRRHSNDDVILLWLLLRFLAAPGHRQSHWDIAAHQIHPLIARFMGPTWSPSGADRTHVGPMLAPRTLLSGLLCVYKTILRPSWHFK